MDLSTEPSFTGGGILGGALAGVFALTWWPWTFWSLALALAIITISAIFIVPPPSSIFGTTPQTTQDFTQRRTVVAMGDGPTPGSGRRHRGRHGAQLRIEPVAHRRLAVAIRLRDAHHQRAPVAAVLLHRVSCVEKPAPSVRRVHLGDRLRPRLYLLRLVFFR